MKNEQLFDQKALKTINQQVEKTVKALKNLGEAIASVTTTDDSYIKIEHVTHRNFRDYMFKHEYYNTYEFCDTLVINYFDDVKKTNKIGRMVISLNGDVDYEIHNKHNRIKNDI